MAASGSSPAASAPRFAVSGRGSPSTLRGGFSASGATTATSRRRLRPRLKRARLSLKAVGEITQRLSAPFSATAEGGARSVTTPTRSTPPPLSPAALSNRQAVGSPGLASPHRFRLAGPSGRTACSRARVETASTRNAMKRRLGERPSFVSVGGLRSGADVVSGGGAAGPA